MRENHIRSFIVFILPLAFAALSVVADGAGDLETELWQAKIDTCAKQGGGRVVVPCGRHVVGQLYLRSGVELHLEEGASLEGAVGLHNYVLHRLPYSEGDWCAVVMGLNVTNVAITGKGEIFGNGAAFEPVRTRGICWEGYRPRGIFFSESKGIRLEDFKLRDAACWGIVFKCCEDIVARRVTVDSNVNHNNDGFDVEAKNVLIEDCDVDSGDDAYCVKSNNPDFTVENVVVRNCRVRSHCNGLKIGTATHGTIRGVRFEGCRIAASRRVYRDLTKMPDNPSAFVDLKGVPKYLCGPGISAICIECVDGGTVENVTVRDVGVQGFQVPIFVRGGARRKRTCGIPPSDRHVLRDIVISNVRGRAESMIASSVSGCPACYPKNVRIENIDIVCRGAGASSAPTCEPGAEYDDCYPEATMFRELRLPAFGLYVGRAENVSVENVRFRLRDGDTDGRQPIYLSSAREMPAAQAEIPLDGHVYDDYLKTQPGKERKAFLREAFGGGQFDMRDLFELVEATKENEWDVKKAAQLDKLVHRGIGRAGGPDSDCGKRIVAVRERIVEPIKKKHNIIVDGVHGYSAEGYVEPKSPAVREALERFRDRKLGLMIHFGIYSQLGIHESWPLVDKEAGWSRSLVDWQTDGETFKREYWSMAESFNPVRFQPEVWAETARRDGFRYLVFTTKHHDGFCLFDSKYSDFKVTMPSCPFSKNPKADIVRHVFDAFRARGLTISCYFSKPDWHHPDYWDNHGLGQTVDRMPTYDVEEHPERWARYREFVRNQLLELTRDYGPLDQLWLDGGQVQKHQGLDIRIEEIIEEARQIQPGLIAVDRATGTESENVVTPEQTVPPVPIMVPWESCITMGTGFSYRYDDTFKSARELIHLLIDVVAKGGNLALNVAPAPDGRLPRPAIDRMDAMGTWLAKNGKAIYGTRVLAPYRVGDWAFTQDKDGSAYAMRLWKDDERRILRIVIPKDYDNAAVRRVIHLASGTEIPFERTPDGLLLRLPETLETDEYADVFIVSR